MGHVLFGDEVDVDGDFLLDYIAIHENPPNIVPVEVSGFDVD